MGKSALELEKKLYNHSCVGFASSIPAPPAVGHRRPFLQFSISFFLAHRRACTDQPVPRPSSTARRCCLQGTWKWGDVTSRGRVWSSQMVGWMDGARLEGLCGGSLRRQRGSRAARRSTRDSVSLQIVTRENGWEVKGNRESNEEGGIVGGD